MMEEKDDTGYTPSAEDNLLGLTTAEQINECEAQGVIEGEKFLLGLDENVEITSALILQIHKTTFGHLYPWAGKWRDVSVKVGAFVPPDPTRIPNLIYQFADELSYRIAHSPSEALLVSTLSYCHYKIVYIHPFNNGNGRTARLLTNLIAYKHGYRDINIYHRTGEKRKSYIEAIRLADKNDFTMLEGLIRKELARF